MMESAQSNGASSGLSAKSGTLPLGVRFLTADLLCPTGCEALP